MRWAMGLFADEGEGRFLGGRRWRERMRRDEYLLPFLPFWDAWGFISFSWIQLVWLKEGGREF